MIEQNMTLGEWFPLWLTTYKKDTMRENSFHQLELLGRLLPESLTGKLMSDIRPMDLQQFINTFAQDCSKSYLDKMRCMLNALFSAAMDNDFCTKNPMRRVRLPRVTERPREAFSVDEVKHIISYAMCCENRRIAVAVITLLLTGLRRGELLGLKWGDLTADTLRVNRAVYLQHGKPYVEEHRAKTAASLRSVPLLPELSYMIQTLPKYGEFVFSTRTGRMIHPRNFSRDYAQFFAQLREEYPEIRPLSPHCCRHTFATLALASSGDIRTVQQLLGHTDIKTTARYTHPDIEAMRLVVSELRGKLYAS